MVKAEVLNLNDPMKMNRWVIGTPEEVPKSSPFYSQQIQIKYCINPEKRIFLEREVEHWHTRPIEEYYFVLQGSLKIKVEGSIFVIKPMQILPVPPEKCHRVVDYTLPIQFIIIRAPTSSKKTKIELTKEKDL